MSTLIRAILACALAGHLAGAACSPSEDTRPGGLGVGMSAHDCWTSYVGAALDAGVVDSADWPLDCVDYLARLSSGPCAEALARVCGADQACANTPACAAVSLMAEFDDGRDRCQAALEDPAHYPDCHAINDCDVLVARTCGEAVDAGLPCQDQPACTQALLLQTDAAQSHLYSVCSQALQESTLYPRCAS